MRVETTALEPQAMMLRRSTHVLFIGIAAVALVTFRQWSYLDRLGAQNGHERETPRAELGKNVAENADLPSQAFLSGLPARASVKSPANVPRSGTPSESTDALSFSTRVLPGRVCTI